MKKLLAMLIAGAFATVAFANEASAPMSSDVKAPASAEKKAAKKHHKAGKKHHGKKDASTAQ